MSIKQTLARRDGRLDVCRPRVERRGDGEDAQRVIVGYAAVFYRADDPGTEYQLYEDMYERIMPGAFDAAIREPDVVRALTNHDENWLLGRSDQGTLRLSVDATGLRYEIDPPDTQAGRDTVALLERGDLDGSSFGFRIWGGKRGKSVWVDEVRDGRDITVREIQDLELVDVGPVTFPAYEATAAGVRSGFDSEEVHEDLQRWREDEEQARQAERLPVELELDLAIAEAELSVS